MKISSLWKACLLTGISLGTAWAIRGHFGHEQGATWAGAIGVLALLVLANRADWYSRAFRILLAGAIGWGIGGIMSYGLLVGYGHATDLLNASYGLLMLFVVGGLYGYIGGGLVGLALNESETNKIDWSRLIVEMVIGGILGYFFMIAQFGWLMTPPRDENWAACLGAALMLAWHIQRKGNPSILKVALWSALGAGFGFASGNFYQVIGNTLEFKFNMWNVMEYSIGFWGGIGMAYGVFTSVWPENPERKPINFQKIGIIFFTLVLPFIVWDQSFGTPRMTRIYTAIGYQDWVATIQTIAFVLIPAFFFYWYQRWLSNKELSSRILGRASVFSYFLSYLGGYIIFSLLVKGALFSTKEVEQYLYLVNFLVLFFWMKNSTDSPFEPKSIPFRKIYLGYVLALGIIVVLAWIASQSHGEMSAMQLRFK